MSCATSVSIYRTPWNYTCQYHMMSIKCEVLLTVVGMEAVYIPHVLPILLIVFYLAAYRALPLGVWYKSPGIPDT